VARELTGLKIEIETGEDVLVREQRLASLANVQARSVPSGRDARDARIRTLPARAPPCKTDDLSRNRLPLQDVEHLGGDFVAAK
jgi:hypothetical protein